MPWMIVWPVSGFWPTRKVGSSSAKSASAACIFSLSACVFGSIAIETTGSGKTIRSSTIGFCSAHSVSPVPTPLMPAIAPISPENSASISSRWFACRRISRRMRSRFCVRGFQTFAPLRSSPEYTRMKINLPTNGSVATLNASAHSGSKSPVVRSSASSVFGCRPCTAGTSSGDGR